MSGGEFPITSGVPATHHGWWCDEGRSQEACPTCRDASERRRDEMFPSPLGYWLLARLAVYAWSSRRVAKNRQEPLFGLGLRTADHLEVARLERELGVLRGSGPESVR